MSSRLVFKDETTLDHTTKFHSQMKLTLVIKGAIRILIRMDHFPILWTPVGGLESGINGYLMSDRLIYTRLEWK